LFDSLMPFKFVAGEAGGLNRAQRLNDGDDLNPRNLWNEWN
jgi:hypothetical protein